MKRIVCIASLGCLVVAAGCRRDPMLSVYIDEINAEKRMLENRLNDMQMELEAKDRELERLKRGLGGRDSAERGSRGSGSEGLPIPRIEVPSTSPGERSQGDDRDLPDFELTPPTIEPGEKSQSRRETPGRAGQAVGTPVSLSRHDTRVADLVIDSEQTGGQALDQVPGDDGIRVVLQPRDEKGDYLPRAAPVRIELLEAESGKSLAVWEYSAEEVELALHRAGVRPGALLQMRLPREPRPQRRFRLVVHYLPPGQPPIARETLIELEPTSPATSSWTPRRGELSREQASGAGEPGSAHVLNPDDTASSSASLSKPQPTGAEANRPVWRPFR